MSHLPTSSVSTKLAIAETMLEVLADDRDQLLAESSDAAVGRLELALEDIGWQRMVAYAHTEFSRSGVERIAVLSRLMWRKNPLIRRAVNVRTYFCWARGVAVAADDERVNEVVQACWSDPRNQQAAFGHEAAEQLDRTLATDGNVVFVLPTSQVTGAVQVRTIPWTELQEPVRNPDDALEVWYWRRRQLKADGQVVEQLHPDIDYRPNGVRTSQVSGLPVVWDQPVMVVTADRLGGETWGVSEVYAALDWARAYKEFLEDWASYVKALAKFAWTHKTGSKQAAIRARTTHQVPRTSTTTGETTAAGATATGTDVDGLKPVNQTGAHVDADSGRQLAMMVGAAMDLPFTLLTGDADNSNLATAQALDRPFELAMQSRQRRWAGWLRRILDHAIDSAARAPRGALPGRVSRDEWGRTIVLLPDGMVRDIAIDFPPLTEHDIKDFAEAMKAASEAVEMPPEVSLTLLLTAFGVDDVDRVVEDAMAAAAQAATREDAEQIAESVVVEAIRRELQEGRAA